MDHILFLTGRLAERSLERVLRSMEPCGFTWEIREIGLQVAGLMTADMIRRRVERPVQATRIVVPGRCRGDLEALHAHFGIPVERGPEELKDLPAFFRRGGSLPPLDDYRVEIFAEIVDAPHLGVPEILDRARKLVRDGADVIDLGCLPETPFPHLEESIAALQQLGFRVSADSSDVQELLRAGRAGADYLLSLTTETLWVAAECEAIPVLIPARAGDLDSLFEAMELMEKSGRPYLADAILDPLPFGFTQSIVRFDALRQRFPKARLMVGIGNVTELTEADTTGINALLLGICAELDAAAVLTTQVSPHARRAVAEADHARRIMHLANAERMLPKDISGALATTHERSPFPNSPEEIAEIAGQVRDPNFRIQVAADGIHVYNRDGLRKGTDAFELWPQLRLDSDAAHAFYMGFELAHAQLAWGLGKRYVQDRPLNWGCALEQPEREPACAPRAAAAKEQP